MEEVGKDYDNQVETSVSSGDVEIDLEGSAVEIDERIIEIQGQAEWSVLLDIIKTARDNAIQAAKDVPKDAGLPERDLLSKLCLIHAR